MFLQEWIHFGKYRFGRPLIHKDDSSNEEEGEVIIEDYENLLKSWEELIEIDKTMNDKNKDLRKEKKSLDETIADLGETISGLRKKNEVFGSNIVTLESVVVEKD